MSLYEQEHQIFRSSIKRFADKEILPVVDSWEKDKDFPSDIFRKLGNDGFLGILIDEEWGGVGRDYLYAAAWSEEFGRIPAVGFTTGVNMHSLIVTPTVQRYGSAEAKARWLADAVAGTAIGAYAFTEPGAGSDLTQIQTKAVFDGKDWLLNGSKIFITNGARAHFVLVLAKTEPAKGYDGYTTFIVDTSDPGFVVSRKLEKLGWHSSDTTELSFSDVRVSPAMVLGEVNRGWYQAMSSLEWERLMLTLSAVGGAQACFETTVAYINDRKYSTAASGASIATGAANASVEPASGGRSALPSLHTLIAGGTPLPQEVSLAKRNICELAIEIANQCVQLHGGYGYTTEFKPERWLRDLRLNTIGGGTSEIMTRIAAKELFGGKEFE